MGEWKLRRERRVIWTAEGGVKCADVMRNVNTQGNVGSRKEDALKRIEQGGTA
ncbi:MAG: hypothetical protein J6Z36_00245 [Clostridia bacterium]|nr:hypothetical protein [Clostridia bacterium]